VNALHWAPQYVWENPTQSERRLCRPFQSKSARSPSSFLLLLEAATRTPSSKVIRSSRNARSLSCRNVAATRSLLFLSFSLSFAHVCFKSKCTPPSSSSSWPHLFSLYLKYTVCWHQLSPSCIEAVSSHRPCSQSAARGPVTDVCLFFFHCRHSVRTWYLSPCFSHDFHVFHYFLIFLMHHTTMWGCLQTFQCRCTCVCIVDNDIVIIIVAQVVAVAWDCVSYHILAWVLCVGVLIWEVIIVLPDFQIVSCSCVCVRCNDSNYNNIAHSRLIIVIIELNRWRLKSAQCLNTSTRTQSPNMQ